MRKLIVIPAIVLLSAAAYAGTRGFASSSKAVPAPAALEQPVAARTSEVAKQLKALEEADAMNRPWPAGSAETKSVDLKTAEAAPVEAKPVEPAVEPAPAPSASVEKPAIEKPLAAKPAEPMTRKEPRVRIAKRQHNSWSGSPSIERRVRAEVMRAAAYYGYHL